MPRRVLHLLGSSGHDGTGIARIVAELHAHLDRKAYEVHACFVGDEGPLVRELGTQGIPTSVVPWRHPSRDPVGLVRVLSYLRRDDFDIIHLHWGGPTLRWFAQRSTKAKLVLHLHSCFDEVSQIRLAALPTENANAVIAVSKSVAAASSHPNTRIIHPGINPPPTQSNQTLGLQTIGFAGRLTPVKGLSHLLQATALLRERLPALRLEIAGEGPERESLQREAAALGIDMNVEFLGWVVDLVPAMSKWSIFVQPSLDEGLPITVIEAMFAGLPVIASRVGGLSEVVDDNVTGLLVPPADPKALASAIGQLAKEEGVRQKMGVAGKARAQREFTAERMALQTAALYDQLLSL